MTTGLRFSSVSAGRFFRIDPGPVLRGAGRAPACFGRRSRSGVSEKEVRI